MPVTDTPFLGIDQILYLATGFLAGMLGTGLVVATIAFGRDRNRNRHSRKDHP